MYNLDLAEGESWNYDSTWGLILRLYTSVGSYYDVGIGPS